MKHLTLIVLLILFTGTIFFLEQRIQAYDLRFYYGKDNGIFVRFESICIMSSLFYTIQTKGNRFISGIIGLITGIFSSILIWLLSFVLYDYIKISDLYFHIFSVTLFITLFYLREHYLIYKKLK